MKRIYLLILVLFFVVSCSTSQSHRIKTSRTDGLIPTGKSLNGTASWYGKRFHGRKTANGERYNMHALTVAHKKLPFGTLLEVTNLSNNKTVIVRVNDRGPYVGRRIIDLSYGAAKEIDMVNDGTTKVIARIMIKKPEPQPVLEPQQNDGLIAGILEDEIEDE